jgi:hypothetical protein
MSSVRSAVAPVDVQHKSNALLDVVATTFVNEHTSILDIGLAVSEGAGPASALPEAASTASVADDRTRLSDLAYGLICKGGHRSSFLVACPPLGAICSLEHFELNLPLIFSNHITSIISVPYLGPLCFIVIATGKRDEVEAGSGVGWQ